MQSGPSSLFSYKHRYSTKIVHSIW